MQHIGCMCLLMMKVLRLVAFDEFSKVLLGRLAASFWSRCLIYWGFGLISFKFAGLGCYRRKVRRGDCDLQWFDYLQNTSCRVDSWTLSARFEGCEFIQDTFHQFMNCPRGIWALSRRLVLECFVIGSQMYRLWRNRPWCRCSLAPFGCSFHHLLKHHHPLRLLHRQTGMYQHCQNLGTLFCLDSLTMCFWICNCLDLSWYRQLHPEGATGACQPMLKAMDQVYCRVPL